MEITHILETHLHADFVSGHLDLAEMTGARIYAPKSAECDFNHVALAEGDTFEIEDMSLRVIETPGHTPEHISYVVIDKSRGSDPVGVFCGDTLFVGDVGRPDLFPDMAEELASRLFDSLHEKILKLPDFCEVYPAHGAGSLCGRAMGAKRRSAIGYEIKYNEALKIKDRTEFVESLTTDMPPAPDHFSRCSAINSKGPELTQKLPTITGLKPQDFHKRSEEGKTIILDTRSYDSYGGQHVPGSYHIDLGGNFATFCGWLLPPDADILLVSYDKGKSLEAVELLRSVGLDRAIGCLNGSMFNWSKVGLPTAHVDQLSMKELYEMSKSKSGMVFVDVRSTREYEGPHIKGTINIPLHDLRTRYKELDPDKPTVLICSTGHRSSTGASILKQQGFRQVFNVGGGMKGYSAAGYAPECPVCFVPHGPQFLKTGMDMKAAK
jgi:glyoxylase-like metal-dependent hydrolase (beta-lactamase superfamily II)/rhodanese-related sulfurtransferase